MFTMSWSVIVDRSSWIFIGGKKVSFAFATALYEGYSFIFLRKFLVACALHVCCKYVYVILESLHLINCTKAWKGKLNYIHVFLKHFALILHSFYVFLFSVGFLNL